MGTSTEKYLNDPLYIGVRRMRPSPEEVRVAVLRSFVIMSISSRDFQMDEFMDEFMDAMKEVFPNLLVQFEDFSTDNAFKYLSRFRQKYRCFNDDVSSR